MISSHSKDVGIAGDFNINLLHISFCNEEHYAQFLDLILVHSLYPKIKLPTHTAENICSLTDNVLCSIL